MARRFDDGGERLWDFAGGLLVRCPRCSGRAVVRPTAEGRVAYFDPRTLACAACGHTVSWPRAGAREQLAVVTDSFTKSRHGRWESIAVGGPVDPYFRLPLRGRRAQVAGGIGRWLRPKRRHLLRDGRAGGLDRRTHVAVTPRRVLKRRHPQEVSRHRYLRVPRLEEEHALPAESPRLIPSSKITLSRATCASSCRPPFPLSWGP